jgi:signal transduction histidine kinase
MGIQLKTQHLLGSILFILLLTMVTLVVFLNINANKTKRAIFEESRKMTEKRFATLLTLYNKNKLLIINDYTFWDEMVTFVQQKDLKWGEDNITPMLENYVFDFANVYSSNGEKFANCAIRNNHISTGVIFNDELNFFLNNPGVYHWYTVANNQIVEVFGATIHPTEDPEHQTAPAGFFLLANLIDSVYINRLKQTMEGEIVLVMNNSNDAINIQDDKIMTSVPLKNRQGQVLAFLQLRHSPQFLELFQISTKRVLALSLVSAIIILLVFYLVLIRFVSDPLQLISQILTQKTGVSNTDKLKRYGYEFSQIGEMIKQSVQQQQQLVILKDKAEESDRLKSTFLANMSHEIRTPINGLIGFSELLAYPDTTPEMHAEYQRIMKSCARDLMHIMDDIIEISKIDAGEIKLRNQSFSIIQLFSELELLFTQQINIKEKKIRLIIVPPKNNIILIIDGYRLKQILSILLDNAIKFTETGHVELTYKYQPPLITFKVKDTGIGIRKEKIDIIFEQFRQSEEHLARVHGGNGLGLAILKRLTKMMNGTIEVESEVGKGTIFKLTFPVDGRGLHEGETEIKAEV